ncbi:hypothetical protein FJZ27_00445 [Candidatus Peribacteria bacterium]|nr:hypothetical protein [Candidatus Peribacteria bacterium]
MSKHEAQQVHITPEDLAEASELAGVDGLSKSARDDLFAALQLVTEKHSKEVTEQNAETPASVSREREALQSFEANAIVMSINPHHVRALEGYIANIERLRNGQSVGTQMRYTQEGDMAQFRSAEQQLAIEIEGAAKVVQAISHAIDEHFAVDTDPNPQARAAQDQLLSILGSLLETAQDPKIIGDIDKIRSIRSDVQNRVDKRHKQDRFRPHIGKNAWTGTRGAA